MFSSKTTALLVVVCSQETCAFEQANRRQLVCGLGSVLLQQQTAVAYSSEAYDRYASNYDALDGGPLARALGIEGMREKYVSPLRGDILEICAGTGLNSQFFASDARVTYADMSRGMLEVAKKRRGAASVVLADARQLPFEKASFDAVLETFCLCVLEEPERTLTEVARVLRPGGTFVLIDNTRPDQPLLKTFLDATGPLLDQTDLSKQCRPFDVLRLLQTDNFTALFDILQADTFGAGFFTALKLRRRS